MHVHADVFDKVANFERRQAIAESREDGTMPYYRVVESLASPVTRMEGRDRLMFGSNNYLGLTADPRVRAAARDALDTYGPALTGARLQNGTIGLHVELEEELAQWMGTGSALVFTTGYQANLGCISALAAPGDAVVVDSADHASILDGAALSGARVIPFRHGRADKLEQVLQHLHGAGTPVLVAVDGLFSMEGTLADLQATTDLCRRYEARLLVDEAHAVGVLGERGAGASELLGVEHHVDLRMGTFSKALASCGGFIAGSSDVIDYLRFASRPFLFTVSVVPPAAAAALAAVRICRSGEGRERFATLLSNARYLHDGLRSSGFAVVAPTLVGDPPTEVVTPIISVEVGSDEDTVLLWRALWDEGVYVNAALHPAVPPGRSLLRASVMASHERAHLDGALRAFEAARRRCGGDRAA